MDKIYSRTRIRIPQVKMFIHNKKLTKLYYFLTMWAVVIITISMMMKFITPPFERKCITETKRISVEVLNSEVINILSDADYEDIITITKDENQKITMVKSNIVLINLLKSNIMSNVQKRFVELERQEIKIPMGVLTGNNTLAGFGPNIKIKIAPTGSVTANFTSSFEGAGINQTIHRLYLEVSCDVAILTPYGNISSDVNDKILFAENIIVGEVPQSFYNLEGIRSNETLNLMD